MKRQIHVEGDSLDICRAKAAKELDVPPEDIRLAVLQKGANWIFWQTPYKVRASIKEKESKKAAEQTKPQLSGLELRLSMIEEELQSMDLSDDKRAQDAFEKMLQAYDGLSPERRDEIKELAGMLSGAESKDVQEKISKPGTFDVRVSDDKLSAVLDVTPPEGVGEPVKLHDVLNTLREQGIMQGVDHIKVRRVLEDVLDLGKPLGDVEIACGKSPVDGEDGDIEYYVMPPSKETIVRDDGSVDWHGKAKINAVKEGERLARLAPPGAGEVGVDVYGNPIPARSGKPARLEAGPNVTLDKESMTFFADIDGIVELKGTTLSVRPVFVVRGDVGMESGSVEFDGAVEVSGSVQSGFYVRASGNITIQGNVEAAEIVSRTGDVEVKKGIAGKGRCFVSAHGDVKAKYIENATVYARGNVEVSSAILHSHVTAGQAVLVLAGRGSIMGGTTRAGELVQTKRLGAENEPHTVVIVGIDIDEHEHLAEIDRQVVSLMNIAVHIEEVVKAIEHKGKDLSQLSRSDREKVKSLRMKLLMVHNEIDSLNRERDEFLGEVVAMARGSVNVSGEAYGKVEIHIGTLVDALKARVQSVTFMIPEGEECISREPFKDEAKDLK